MNVLTYNYVHAATARRPMGTDPRARSRGTHPGGPRGPQAGSGASSRGSGAVDSQYRRAIGPAAGVLPNYTTVHRRFQQWCERAVRREMLTQLANTWRAEGEIDERE